MDLISRLWKAQYPPEAIKTADPIRFGVLGAAYIS